jgi:Flp pilus assembly protein TadG
MKPTLKTKTITGRHDLIEVEAQARGQTLLETAIVLPILLLMLFVAIQLAIIGNVALSVTQLSYTGSRYASVNPTFGTDEVVAYMKQAGSPTITDHEGKNLTITMTPCTSPSSYGSQVTVNVEYKLNAKIFLPNPFLGVSFPDTLSSSQTAFCE